VPERTDAQQAAYNRRVRQHDDPISASLDTLSSVGRQLLRLDAANAYTRLVVDSDGNDVAKGMLENLTPRDLIDGPLASPDDAAAVMSGLWLRHDWLDQSHRISQGIDTPTGSFWHAIMHRREGDFSNSKYWYNRCGEHPVLRTIGIQAADVINPHPADKSLFRIIASGWSPAAFVDLVQQVHAIPDDPRHRIAVAIQQIEWRVLFEHCTRAACGR
jgi:hypothetical protein